MKMKLMTGIATFALATVAPMAFGQLLNGSFENGSGSTAANWGQFGNSFREELPSDARTGTFVNKQFGNFSGGTDVTGTFQDLVAGAGDTVSASVFAKTLSVDQISGTNEAFLRIAFFNAANAEIGGINSAVINSASAVDTWSELMASAVAPTETAKAQVLLLFIQQNSAGGSVLFDDVTANVEAVPEPATMAVLGLAAVAALRKRRQK